ncbi:MAG: DUF2336 domain-containing protein [Bdellovibrionales bacterium]
MDIGLLEKAEHMKPLLVKLYDTHHVYNLAGDKKPEARAELGAIVSELLDVSVDTREKDLVADILLALVQQACVRLRQALAEKLSTMDGVPSRLILNFAYDEIDVAESVLKHSPVLDTLDLMYILQSKPAEYWAAVAARKDLPASIVDELSSLDDEHTHVVLVSNQDVVFSDKARDNLFESAKASDEVARPFLERSDVPRSLAKKLYDFVGEQIKQFIDEKYGFSGHRLDKAVDQAVEACLDGEIIPAEVENPYLPSKGLMASEYAKLQIMSERVAQVRNLMLKEMLQCLKLKDYKIFVAKFSVYMGIKPEETLEIISQKYGHGLAILSRAHGVDRSDFIKIFLLTDVIRSSEHVMQGVTLNRALAYYDRLDADIARSLYQKYFPQ